MNIVMMTNTYLPHVGGVARSVATFSQAYRRAGHRVLIIAPTYPGPAGDEPDVVRVPALQNFNGSDFSLRLPIPGLLFNELDRFAPDIIHSHHPYLLGDTALRMANWVNRPLVFTHHTMYERYTHYVPGDSPAMKRFAIHMATEYANLADHVIAPSDSIARTLRDRGVVSPVTPLPTGIDPAAFATGDGPAARDRYGIPRHVFVVGYVGRLAPEKNLPLLTRAAGRLLRRRPDAHFLVVGSGASDVEIAAIAAELGVAERVHLTGPLTGQPLADAYHAMDVFAFASQTETQGMVLAEAMTAGVPVAAVDAPGVREVVRDGHNGRLLDREDADALADALAELADAGPTRRRQLQANARATARDFALDRCAAAMLDLYARLGESAVRPRPLDEDNAWSRIIGLIGLEWNIWSSRAQAAARSLSRPK